MSSRRSVAYRLEEPADVSALIMVNVRPGHWRNLAEQLRALAGVEWVGVATGSFDFVIHARAWSLDHLRDVVLSDVRGIEGIRSSETIVLLDEFDQRRRPVGGATGPRRHRGHRRSGSTGSLTP